MVPGTAVGVLVGDAIYTWMAVRLARRTGRTDVTAMPLGLDTPSTFGAVFLILGPSFRAAIGRGLSPLEAARHAWFLGMTLIVASGVFKLGCATVSGPIRRIVPRAGLLGSLTAIALVIISFLPLLDMAAQPVAGCPPWPSSCHPYGALGVAGSRPGDPGGRCGWVPGLLWHEPARPGADGGRRRRGRRRD
jgi:AGZA family xanthine/uracil permease-like MFS transporter